MPLSMAAKGVAHEILRVGGNTDTRHFLNNLGFVPGAKITVMSLIQGNMIVNIKESRVAIGKDMANKIMVSENRE